MKYSFQTYNLKINLYFIKLKEDGFLEMNTKFYR